MDKQKIAVFIGHRDCFEVTEATVTPIIEQVINEGVIDFINGGMGHFDFVCARAVFKLKEKYPQIRSYIMVPYEHFKIFDESLFDEVIKPYQEIMPPTNFRVAIPRRNMTMVSYAGIAICYVGHMSKGSAKTLEIARKNGLKIYNLYDDENSSQVL